MNNFKRLLRECQNIIFMNNKAYLEAYLIFRVISIVTRYNPKYYGD